MLHQFQALRATVKQDGNGLTDRAVVIKPSGNLGEVIFTPERGVVRKHQNKI